MHEQRIGFRKRHQLLIDLKGRQPGAPVVVASAHRHPGVGDYAVGLVDGLSRVGVGGAKGGRTVAELEAEVLKSAAPNNCVAPSAWKYAASATNANTTPVKYFLIAMSKVTGPVGLLRELCQRSLPEKSADSHGFSR